MEHALPADLVPIAKRLYSIYGWLFPSYTLDDFKSETAFVYHHWQVRDANLTCQPLPLTHDIIRKKVLRKLIQNGLDIKCGENKFLELAKARESNSLSVDYTDKLPEPVLYDDLTQIHVDEFFSTLEPEHAEIATLLLDRKTLVEISSHTGMTIKRIRNRIDTIREKCRKYFSSSGY